MGNECRTEKNLNTSSRNQSENTPNHKNRRMSKSTTKKYDCSC